MAGPPVMSSVWFPVHQRTTATGFSAAMNNLGEAVAFIIGTCTIYASNDFNISSSACQTLSKGSVVSHHKCSPQLLLQAYIP